MSKQSILVTGGLGFIGSHTVVELLQANYEVVVVDNLNNSRIQVLKGIRKTSGKDIAFYPYDTRDEKAMKEVFEKHPNIDGVIHFAAYKAVGESVAEPLKYYDNNIYGLVALLKQMQTNGIKAMLFSSSCTVYGQPEKLPISEHTPLKPAESPYGNTKKMGEEIVVDATKTGDFKAISLRYFNPVGAHPDGFIGELPIGVPQNLIPFVTQTAAGLRKELSVFGNDYPTPDGTAIRDYIHVVDLARVHVKAMARLLHNEGPNYDVFNVGTGRGYSVLEVIKAFERISGQALPYHFAPRRAGDVVQVYADASKAEQELQWKAQYDIDDMMRDAWNFQNNILDKTHILNEKES